MNIYTQKQRWKALLLVAALLIGAASLWYTSRLVKQLSDEEKKKIQLWTEATKRFAEVDIKEDIVFLGIVIANNTTIPVIQTDDKGNIMNSRNLDSLREKDTVYLKEHLETMKSQHEPILIDIKTNNGGIKQYLYYEDSKLLVKLRYYPYFQLGVIALFLFVSYLAFSTSRKAEQNQVWVGMAKETAHQLGTPLSSLMAWLDFLKAKGIDKEHTQEIEKDIIRLQTITERFSKIGAAPALKKENIRDVMQTSMDYMKSRSSEKIIYTLVPPANEILVPINVPLFQWVIENVLKNSIDAMGVPGKITVTITDQQQFAYIDIADTGKGISKANYKTIFKPGYTTKNRGWGLGLSLSKRIIEEYHDGQIFVKSSEPGKGTVIRIVLKK